MVIRGNQYGNMGYQVSNGRDTKLDRFSTKKNQHMDIIVFCEYTCVIILENNVF